jgi:hypothetical protein
MPCHAGPARALAFTRGGLLRVHGRRPRLTEDRPVLGCVEANRALRNAWLARALDEAPFGWATHDPIVLRHLQGTVDVLSAAKAIT